MVSKTCKPDSEKYFKISAEAISIFSSAAPLSQEAQQGFKISSIPGFANQKQNFFQNYSQSLNAEYLNNRHD